MNRIVQTKLSRQENAAPRPPLSTNKSTFAWAASAVALRAMAGRDGDKSGEKPFHFLRILKATFASGRVMGSVSPLTL